MVSQKWLNSFIATLPCPFDIIMVYSFHTVINNERKALYVVEHAWLFKSTRYCFSK